MEKKETLLESFEFLKDDPRWAGAVEIVSRHVDQPDGTSKDFLDMRLRIGRGLKYIPLPRRGLEEVVSAVQKAKASADGHFQKRVLARSTQGTPSGRKTAH